LYQKRHAGARGRITNGKGRLLNVILLMAEKKGKKGEKGEGGGRLRLPEKVKKKRHVLSSIPTQKRKRRRK